MADVTQQWVTNRKTGCCNKTSEEKIQIKTSG
jgi:hypothetical protein